MRRTRVSCLRVRLRCRSRRVPWPRRRLRPVVRTWRWATPWLPRPVAMSRFCSVSAHARGRRPRQAVQPRRERCGQHLPAWGPTRRRDRRHRWTVRHEGGDDRHRRQRPLCVRRPASDLASLELSVRGQLRRDARRPAGGTCARSRSGGADRDDLLQPGKWYREPAGAGLRPRPARYGPAHLLRPERRPAARAQRPHRLHLGVSRSPGRRRTRPSSSAARHSSSTASIPTAGARP